MAQTAIKPCHCSSSYQDEKYGKGQRVWNAGKEGNYRCTVCGTVKKFS